MREKFLAIENDLNDLVVERREEIHGLLVAVLSGLNVLLLGSPGVAKSLLINLLTSHLDGGKVFSRLLTSFSTPEELFGPFSMNKIKQDKYERVTDNTVLDADIAFIDETFKANSGILNSLLQVMNERSYLNGTNLMKLPLITMVGASNELNDESDGLEALFDRFHLKYVVKPIQEPGNFMKMLESTKLEGPIEFENKFTRKDLEKARKEINAINLTKDIIHKMTKLREELSHAGLFVTDRTYKSSIKVLRTEAWLHGHDEINEDDLDILRHMFWTTPEKMRTIYMKILEMTNPEKNIVMDKYEESMRLVRELFAEKDPVKANSMAIEYSTKLKDAKKEINKLRATMVSKGKNVDDVDAMLKDINVQIRNIMVDVLQVDVYMD